MGENRNNSKYVCEANPNQSHFYLNYFNLIAFASSIFLLEMETNMNNILSDIQRIFWIPITKVSLVYYILNF